jgi:recombinational DNA repair ATPase RecF
MWIRKLRIKDFRGMKNAVVDFSESQTIFNADS